MIDTHTHIYGKEFADDIEDVVERARRVGVEAIILPNENEKSLEALASMCDKYKGYCFPLYGLHPTEVTKDYQLQLNEIFAFAKERNDSKGIGEIGLDLYWDQSMITEQIEAFAWQIDYSIQNNLPMSIHCRNAYEQLFNVFAQFPQNKLVGSLHCFSGTMDDAKRLMTLYPNILFGVNGTFTYKKSQLPEIFKTIPLEKVILETDAPYLSPLPYRGKRNEPSYMQYVVQTIAQVYNKSVSDVQFITTENARNLFRLM